MRPYAYNPAIIRFFPFPIYLYGRFSGERAQIKNSYITSETENFIIFCFLSILWQYIYVLYIIFSIWCICDTQYCLFWTVFTDLGRLAFDFYDSGYFSFDLNVFACIVFFVTWLNLSSLNINQEVNIKWMGYYYRAV